MRICVLFAVIVSLLPPLALAEKPVSSEERIRALKAAGQPVPSELWREADAQFRAVSAEAKAALRPAEWNKISDGGSSSVDATVIPASPYQDAGNTTGKGNNASLPGCGAGGGDAAEDAWYEVTFNAPATLTVWTTCATTGPPSYDTRLAVFNSSLSLVTCNDDDPNCGAPNYQSRISDLDLNPGTYYIVVDGYGNLEGPYELNVVYTEEGTGCTGGSDISTATPIALPYSAADSTIGACHNYSISCELGQGLPVSDMWYSVVMDTFVFMDIWTTCDTLGIDTRVALLDSNANQIHCNDDDPTCGTNKSRIEDAYLSPGQYYIVVEGAIADGDFTLNVDTTAADPNLTFDILPDIYVRESDLYDNDISTSIVPGRTHLRLSNGTANIGLGKLYMYGVLPGNGDGTQDVRQRIWRTDGTWYDRDAGQFIFHQSHNHIHVEDWASYRIRQILPADGVGAIVAEGVKTSFCILDLGIYDSSLPNFNPSGEFTSCGSSIQGLSVGWIDIYSKGLTGQNIDITDVPDGTYWLESLVDPADGFLESDETNNATRIKVVLGGGPAISPDAFEPNDQPLEVIGRPQGGPNSPNLGPVDPERTVANLTVHTADNEDHFRFYMNDTGTASDFVRINFTNSQGNLDLDLTDSAGVVILTSAGSTDEELISLDGVTEGWYHAKVRGQSGGQSPSYSLTINPSSNIAPVVTPIDPAGTETRIHGQQTYTANWSASDFENDLTWVSLFANTTPALDGNETLLPTSLHTDGAQGFYIINSADLDPGTYYFYFSITDGGTTTGAWSTGTVEFIDITTEVATGTPPTRSIVHAARPNPFNPTTRLRIELPEASDVRWEIYDVGGRLVRTLASGALSAGPHERSWNGMDDGGSPVASGIYFQMLSASDGRTGNRIVLIR